MTNGEKMQEMFPEGKTRRCRGGVVFESDGWCHAYDSDWWNAEYKDPRKGHWIIDTHKIRAFGKKYETHDYSVHCDKCNYACDYTTDKEGSLVSNFCPNCGADMREVEE